MSLKDFITSTLAAIPAHMIKFMQAPRENGKSQRPNKPKTRADYEAMHAAEMKRRRKAEKRALHSNTL